MSIHVNRSKKDQSFPQSIDIPINQPYREVYIYYVIQLYLLYSYRLGAMQEMLNKLLIWYVITT